MNQSTRTNGSAYSAIGVYGEWAASLTREGPGTHSLRGERWSKLEPWRRAAREEVRARMNPPRRSDPEVRVTSSRTVDGLHVEELSWPQPAGAPTRATFLRPADANLPLPGVLALHDHGDDKYFGRRKVADAGEDPHPTVDDHRDALYGGRAWANALARRGYAVLAPDGFAFASRRVRPEEVPPEIRGPFREVDSPDPEGGEDQDRIRAYNAWAAGHESTMAKSLFCAGTTWPGVLFTEDQTALDVLARREEVDAGRLACAGLSGGGLRTVFLAGLDGRIRCSVCAGMMTTWGDFLLRTAPTHTWMIYVPLLPGRLEYPEILGLAAPAPVLVLDNEDDPLFTSGSQREATRILSEVYEIAGHPAACETRAYPGGHKFDVPMQEAAFGWFDRHL